MTSNYLALGVFDINNETSIGNFLSDVYNPTGIAILDYDVEGPGQQFFVIGEFKYPGNIPVNAVRRYENNGFYDSSNDYVLNDIFQDVLYLNNSAIAIQSTGKVVFGYYQTDGLVNRVVVKRFDGNMNGPLTIDNTFNCTFDDQLLSLGGYLSAITVLSDDRLLISGSFTNVNGHTANGVVILLPDGSVDTTFSAGQGVDINVDYIACHAVQSDGKFVLGGSFSTFNTTTELSNLVRLNVNGSVDRSFTAKATNGTVTSIVHTYENIE